MTVVLRRRRLDLEMSLTMRIQMARALMKMACAPSHTEADGCTGVMYARCRGVDGIVGRDMLMTRLVAVRELTTLGQRRRVGDPNWSATGSVQWALTRRSGQRCRDSPFQVCRHLTPAAVEAGRDRMARPCVQAAIRGVAAHMDWRSDAGLVVELPCVLMRQRTDWARMARR